MLSCVYSGIHFEEMTKEQVIGILKDTLEYAKEKDKENERLQNKNEELMTLYTTEREVKDEYKSIIKEVRESAKTKIKQYESYINDLKKGEFSKETVHRERQELIYRIREQEELLEILDKENI